MIIVSDTSPLHYLILIDQIDLLPKLFRDIAVPQTVSDELQADATPIKVRTFMASLPEWLTVLPDSDLSDPALFEIDKGEREAILLAEKLFADGILVDDRAGREMAEKREIFVIGTLGVLEIAAREREVDFKTELSKIKEAGFYVSAELENSFLRRLGLN